MITRSEIIQENHSQFIDSICNEGSFILINKPIGWTSFDVVKKIRSHFKVKKVGHAGTLDPLAEGLLIVATGKLTKKIDEFTKLHKEYIGELVLGGRTASYDSGTEIIEKRNYSNIKHDDIKKIFSEFKGVILQKPPIYSAVKHKGKPLYKYARKGKEVPLIEREVQITNLEILDIKLPLIKFVISCSKGTYIRSLVNDIGERLGCGAYLQTLIRTKIGNYLLTDALEIEDLKKITV